jgi:shikimate kinase
MSRIAVVGTMGAGKTTVGRALAERLGLRYVDNDEQLAASSGRDAATLLREEGEDALRAAERAALAAAVGRAEDVVLGVAAGTAAEPQTRELLAGVTVVFLRARPETLAGRVAGTGRPWVDEDPLGVVTELDARRRPAYEQLADVTVDVDELSVEEVVTEIVRRLPSEVRSG